MARRIHSPVVNEPAAPGIIVIEPTSSPVETSVSAGVFPVGSLQMLVKRALTRISAITGLSVTELTRFVKFATVGAIGMVVDLTVLNVLYRLVLPALVPGLSDGVRLIVANSISFTVAVLSNFTWNRLWTFPESRQRPLGTQLVQFTIVNVIGLAINNLVLWLAFQVTQQVLPDPFDYNIAKITAIGVVLFWNYGANRLWTYRGIK
jgi:putative flippase GtrA